MVVLPVASDSTGYLSQDTVYSMHSTDMLQQPRDNPHQMDMTDTLAYSQPDRVFALADTLTDVVAADAAVVDLDVWQTQATAR